MANTHQEIHLRPAPLCTGEHTGVCTAAAPPAPVPLPFVPVALRDETGVAELSTPQNGVPAGAVVVEPFFNQRKQLRLFALFPAECTPQVNGEGGPGMVVLTPGDFFRWGTGPGFTLALFNRPQIGPPPASVLGKSCPVCSVPFDDRTTCVTCPCGVTLHCEPDIDEGLACAQKRRTCPVCQRPLVLTEGYVAPHSDEE